MSIFGKIIIDPISENRRARGRCPKCKSRLLLRQVLTNGPTKIFECHKCHSLISIVSLRYVTMISAVSVILVSFKNYGSYSPFAWYIALVVAMIVYFDSFLFSIIELKDSFHE